MAQVFTRVSQQAAGYKLMGGVERCGRCRFFLKNNLCARVMGDVSPSAWCRFFSMEARATMNAGGGASATHGGGSGPPGRTQDASFMTALPAGFTYVCSTATTNLLWTDGAGQTITDYAINAPRFLTNGLLLEGARTNRALNSAVPASHTIPNLPVGSFVGWVNGTGSMTIAAGTAVGTGFGTATQGNKLNFDISTAGTVTVTIVGSLNAIQVENTSVAESYAPSSFIRTTGAFVARSTTILTAGPPAGFTLAQGAYAFELLPLNSGSVNCRVMEFVGTAAASDFDRINFSAVAALRGSTNSGGAVQSTATSAASVALNAVHKVAYTVSVGGASICVDATTPVTAGQAARPVDLIAMTVFGLSTGPPNVFGYLRRFQYWPRALSNTELQQVTT